MRRAAGDACVPSDLPIARLGCGRGSHSLDGFIQGKVPRFSSHSRGLYVLELRLTGSRLKPVLPDARVCVCVLSLWGAAAA